MFESTKPQQYSLGSSFPTNSHIQLLPPISDLNLPSKFNSECSIQLQQNLYPPVNYYTKNFSSQLPTSITPHYYTTTKIENASIPQYHPYSVVIQKKVQNYESNKSSKQELLDQSEKRRRMNSQPHENGRRRVSKACHDCQLRHVRCGFQRPCERCTRLGIECRDVPSDKKRGRKSNNSTAIEEESSEHSSSSSTISSCSSMSSVQSVSSPVLNILKPLLPSIHKLLNDTTQ